MQAKLDIMEVKLPTATAPVANYLPCKMVGNLIFVSGQLPRSLDGALKHTGKITKDNIPHGREAAKLCVINCLSQLKFFLEARGKSLNDVKTCVKLGVFVNTGLDFTQQSDIGNGASDFIVEIMGEAGKHVRSSVSCPSLPLDVSVEVDFIFEV